MKINVHNIFRSGIILDLFILVFVCTFIAESQTFTIPYHQNFDSVIVPQLPSGWSTSSNRSQSGDFKTTSSTVHSSPNAVVDSSATIEQSLFSPLFDFSNTVGDSIIFFERRTSAFNAGVFLEAAINGDTTFPFNLSDTIKNAGITNYVRRAFVLPETLNNQSQVQFRWRNLGNGTGTNSSSLRFDDISITAKTQLDIGITYITTNPLFPVVHDSLIVNARVKNYGTAAVQSFPVKLFKDIDEDSSAASNELLQNIIVTNTLAPLDSLEISFTIQNIPNGFFQYIVQTALTNDEDSLNDSRLISVEVTVPRNVITVNEIMFKPQSPEPEWIEFVNIFDDSLNIKSWKFSDKNFATKHTITRQNYWLQKDSFFIVVKDSESFYEVHPLVTSRIFITSSFPSLNNDSDDVILFDGNGTVIDSVHYKIQWGGYGKSLEKIYSDSNSNRASNWGSSEDSAGSTPGKINSLTPRNIDVAITRLDISPLHPLPQTNIFVFALVKNIGLHALTNISVKFYHDANHDSLPQMEELFDTQVISSILVDGDSIFLQTQFNSISAGVNNFIAVTEISGDERLSNNSIFTSIQTATLPQSVVVNEIMYAPIGDEPEWVELFNNSSDSVDLKNWKISDNITATKVLVSSQTQILSPKSFIVLAKDTSLFTSVHYNIPSALLQVSQLPSLNNSGDAVVIYDASSAVVDSVNYKSQWGGSTGGKSLERIYTDSLSNDSTNWSSCTDENKSTPGTINSITPRNIDIAFTSLNIILEYPDYTGTDEADFITTLKNVGLSSITQYTVKIFLDENFDSIPQSSELEEEYDITQMLGTHDSITLHLDELGSYVNPGLCHFIGVVEVAGDERTENNLFIKPIIVRIPNAIVINEIMYAPVAGEPEWIELYNRTNESVEMTNWKIKDESSFAIIAVNNFTLPPFSYAVITNDSGAFRQRYPDCTAFLLYVQQMPTFNNTDDDIVLEDESSTAVDSLYYISTWGGTNGKSLERITVDFYDSSDSLNWGSCISSSTPGLRNSIEAYDRDMKVKNIYSTPYTSRISLHAVIENIGTLDVLTFGNFFVKFYNDENNDSLAQENELISSQTFSRNLHFKDTMIVNYNWSTSFIGKKQIIALVDYSEDENRSNDTLVSSVIFSYPLNSIVINEIMYEPLAGKSEYIEMYNRSNDTIDVEQWKISDARDSSTANTEFLITKYSQQIYPRHYVILAADSTFLLQFPNIDTTIAQLFIINKSSLGLNNDEDDIVLLDATNTVIDSVHYSYRWHNPEVITTQGKSLERIHFDILSNDRRNWSTSVANGTPGKVNSLFVAVLPSSASVSFSPNPFSPDGDGSEDNTIISYNIPAHGASIRIHIFDVKGRMVRELSSNESSGARGEIIWDGRDDDEKIVRIGVYIVFLEAVDAFGSNVFTTKGLVVVAGDLR